MLLLRRASVSSGDKAGPAYSMADLLRVMERLRDPDTGCPWDLRQDFASIVPSTLEECYELAQAIEHEDYPHVAEELGDLLFQVVFYAQLGSERGLFRFTDVVSTLVDKLLRRHPHVFESGEIEGVVKERADIEHVRQSWEEIKQQERHDRDQRRVLADVPLSLPALPRAQKLQKRAARVGFDWNERNAVMKKLREELVELERELSADDQRAASEELGDVLFTCVNLCRHLGVDAESTLRKANSKFEQRFQRMEDSAAEQGASLADLDEDAQDRLWRLAKRD